jgi:hypothetical protein
MLARLFFGLVLGLLMYLPRPTQPRINRPDDSPPSPQDVPPEGDGGDLELPEMAPPIWRHPSPDPPKVPGRGHGRLPNVPPTPPPGYDGEWPPASERDELPPTPPPGYDGDWPGAGGERSVRDQLRELLRQIRELLRGSGSGIRTELPVEADRGRRLLTASSTTTAVDAVAGDGTVDSTAGGHVLDA